MAFRVSLDFDGLPEALEPGRIADVIREEAMRAVNEGTVILKNGLVSASPFGGTNTLRTGWQIVPAVASPGFVRGAVTNATVQAAVIEEGAPPHRPPVDALRIWILRALPRRLAPFVVKTVKGKKTRRPANLGDPRDVARIAFAISQAIEARGLPSREGKPKGFFSRVFRSLEPRVTARMDAMARRITERLAA